MRPDLPRQDFASDNTAPVAPEAISGLIRANAGPAPAYGEDPFTAQAAEMVRALLDADAEVRFLASGTAANALALSMLCRPFETVLAHEEAHVTTGEAGAPGFMGGGLAVAGLPGASGRIDPAALAGALAAPDSAHRQGPAALSLTDATEYGTLYPPEDLARLVRTAKAAGLGVHLDGARLANAVAAGLDLKTLGRMGVDVLVMGGAKAGLPPSEALVVFDKALARRLDARLKNAGQLVSKGRYLAAPWVGMLEDGAWRRHAAHANAMARRLARLMPFPIVHPVEANAVFAALDEAALTRLHGESWLAHRVADGSVRFMCSWATTGEAVDELGEALRRVA
jgi:threonine aldolase